VLTHAIRAAATDGSPVAGFVAAAALLTRTVAARTLRTRHAGGRVIRAGTPPRSCGSCPRVRRYGFRPLDNQASCTAAARIRTASATSPTFPKSNIPRVGATPRVQGQRVTAATRRRPAAIPSGGDGRAGYARLDGSMPRPRGRSGNACGSFRLENQSGGTPLAVGGRSFPCRPPAVFHTLAALSYTP